MRTTTCSRRASSRTGRATRSSPPSAAAASTGAAAPTTRPARSRTRTRSSAWLTTSGALPCNVRVLIEGEEEIGSPTLHAFLDAHVDELRSDVLVLADAGQLEGRRSRPHLFTARAGRGRHRAARARRSGALGHGRRRGPRPGHGARPRCSRRSSTSTATSRSTASGTTCGRRPTPERAPIAGLDDDPAGFARAMGVRPGRASSSATPAPRCTSGCGSGRRSPSSGSTAPDQGLVEPDRRARASGAAEPAPRAGPGARPRARAAARARRAPRAVGSRAARSPRSRARPRGRPTRPVPRSTRRGARCAPASGPTRC